MKRKIEVGDSVMVRIGPNQGKRAEVTTIITTNVKRYWVKFPDETTTSFYYRQLYNVS